MFTILGAIGLSRGSAEVSASSVTTDISATIQQTATAVTGGTVPSGVPDVGGQDAQQAEEDRVIDKIGQMVEESQQEDSGVKPISPEEKAWAEQQPRNTKKRMWEEDVRDEL